MDRVNRAPMRFEGGEGAAQQVWPDQALGVDWSGLRWQGGEAKRSKDGQETLHIT